VNHPFILFDGVCNLCNSSVDLVIDRDPEARFLEQTALSPQEIS